MPPQVDHGRRQCRHSPPRPTTQLWLAWTDHAGVVLGMQVTRTLVMVMLVCTTALAAIAPATASAGVPPLASAQPNCTSIGNNLAGDCGLELPAATGHLPKMMAAGTGF